MCESYAVQLKPDVNVLVVPYSVRLTLYGTRRTSIASLILNSVRLTHNTHVATAQTQRNEVIHRNVLNCNFSKGTMYAP